MAPAPNHHDHSARFAVTAPQFEALLAVQDIDTALDRHRHRRDTLPERAELASIDSRLASAQERLSEAVGRRDVVGNREGALEADLATTEARIAEVNKRLYGGTVSATRELMAMTTDVEHLQARASRLEQEALELLEEREPLDAEVAEIEGEMGRLMAEQDAATSGLRAAEAEIDTEIDALNEQRAAAAANVPADLLATYSRLRERLGGVGASRLDGSRCSGCHLTLSAIELDQLKRESPDALIFCEQCGRILVR
ncbi:MAG TPA: C4-type zinc ribbon domain-containing protein [Acidimicrobiales bacterium]